jgi:hypothetical protein
MSDYSQTTYFAPKDSLITGNPAKLVKGSEVDPELAAISAAIISKYDSADIASNAEAAALTLDTVLITPAKLAYALANGATGLVLATRTVSAGSGLTGGGDLSANRSFALSHLGIQDLTDPGADRIMFWDDSAGFAQWLTLGTGLSITGTTLDASASNLSVANKSGTTSRNTTTTVAADPDLVLSGLSAGTYMVDLLFSYYDTGGASQGIKMLLAGTNATVYLVEWSAQNDGVAPVGGWQAGYKNAQVFGGVSAVTHVPSTSVSNSMMRAKAMIVLSGTGTIEFQWAQAVSNGNNTNVQYGCMNAVKVA